MLLAVIKNRLAFIMATLLISILCACLLNYFTPPVYEAEAKLRLKPPKPLANSLLQENPVNNSATLKQQIATYIELLKSRAVVELALDRLENKSSYEKMLSQISVQPVKDTEILRVAVQTATAVQARDMANAVVSGFAERLNQLAATEQKGLREFIDSRLQEAAEELARAEKELADYKRVHKIYVPSEENRALVDRLYISYKMAQENQIAVASSQARLGTVERQLASLPPGVLADNVSIQQYKVKLAGLQVEMAELLRKYTERHPKVLALRDSISMLQRLLDTEVNRVVHYEAPSQSLVSQGIMHNRIQAEAEVAAAVAQKRALAAMIAENERQLSQLPAKELALARLTRNVIVAQDTYMMLAKRREEARINEAMQLIDVQIIDAAVLPEAPVKPRRLLNIILAVIFGLSAGIAGATFLEYRRPRLKRTEKRHLALYQQASPAVAGATPVVFGSFPPRRTRRKSIFCS